MSMLGQSAFLKALGWALLNSLGQFGLLSLIFILLSGVRKNISSNARHNLALWFLSIGFLWFCGSLSYSYFSYSTAFTAEINTAYFVYDQSWYAYSYNSFRKLIENNLPYLSIG